MSDLSSEEINMLSRFSNRENEPVSCRDNYKLALKLEEKGYLIQSLFGAFRLNKHFDVVQNSTPEKTTEFEVMPLDTETSFSTIIDSGADTLGDVPISDWLTYTKNLCLKIASDDAAEEEMHWKQNWKAAAEAIEIAIKEVNKAIGTQ